MENVYDLAKYKKKKRKMILANRFQENKFALTFLLLISIDVLLWLLVSFTAAAIFTAVALLVPFIINVQKKKKNHKKKLYKPSEQMRNKTTMKASLLKK